jgi:hypothetical protein
LTGLQAVKFNVYEGHFYFLNLQKPNSWQKPASLIFKPCTEPPTVCIWYMSLK